MKRIALALAVLGAAVPAATAGATDTPGAVYTLTNSAAGNAVVAYARAADGSLSPEGTFPTGGLGSGVSLGSQGSLVLSDDGRQLFAVNPGSDSVSLFTVRPDGLELAATAPSGGRYPISLTVRKGVLYVLDAGGGGSISGFAVGAGSLTPIPGSTRPLGAGSAGPAQVQFSPDGSVLVVTEKASSTIDVYPVADGVAGAPTVTTSAGGTPFGFDFDNRGHLLVSEAAGSASSYDVSADGASVISGAVATHQGAPCWLVVSKNGHFAYTANAAAGTISGFAVGQDGSLSLLDPSGVSANLGAGSHPLDEALSGDGRYLYDLADGAHRIDAFRIAADGSLSAAGSVAVPVGADGIAAR
ncbi:MAG TPA: beta-propeller fold lactonase family protein [Gaiellaceae bacterium]